MAVLYVTTGVWGAGVGPLAPAAVDGNFWDHEQRIDTLETTPDAAISISSVELVVGGAAFTITLTNAVVLGPFILPTATFRFIDGWVNSQSLVANDFISVEGHGIFLVLKTHTTPAAPAEFDPLLIVTGDPAYKRIWGVPPVTDYELDLNYLGLIPGSEAKLLVKLVRRAMRLVVGLVDSVFYLDVAPTAAIALKLFKNASEIGTVTFAAASQTGVVNFPIETDFAPGDRLVIKGPVGVDTTAADLAVAIIAANLG